MEDTWLRDMPEQGNDHTPLRNALVLLPHESLLLIVSKIGQTIVIISTVVSLLTHRPIFQQYQFC